MPKKEDMGWEHGAKTNNKPNEWRCNYCNQAYCGGGVTRIKEHVAGIGVNVIKCPKAPKAARDACLANSLELLTARHKKQEQRQKEATSIHLLDESEEDTLYNKQDEVQEAIRHVSNMMNSLLQRAIEEQKKADRIVLRLAEDHKAEKEKLLEQILQLGRQLDAKQALALEVEQLRGSLNVMKHMVEELVESLKEKEEELEHLTYMNQSLVVKERMCNDELMEARKELINNNTRSTSLQRATEEQKKADRNILRLAEDHKTEKEILRIQIVQLEKQLDAKQALALEVERLRSSVNVMKHMGVGEDLEFKKKVEAMVESQDLEFKKKVEAMVESLKEEEELEHLESMNQSLLVKERMSNDELVEARKELINGLEDTSEVATIGVKRMRELDSKPFYNASKRKFSSDEADMRATEMCSLWEEYLRDPKWHPFKNIPLDGGHKEIIDADDEKLKENWGDEVHEAVTTALKEMNEYNPTGRRAKLKEFAKFILTKLKKQKRSRR